LCVSVDPFSKEEKKMEKERRPKVDSSNIYHDDDDKLLNVLVAVYQTSGNMNVILLVRRSMDPEREILLSTLLYFHVYRCDRYSG
jgi:hypothetical protein